MGARRTDMHRLQEMVRLHRLGESSRAIAKRLRMGRDTIRCYLRGLEQAGILEGASHELPDVVALRAATQEELSTNAPPQQSSSIERWRDMITKLRECGAGRFAIYDWLRLHEPDFEGSPSAVKRMCAGLTRAEGPKPTDVAIPVESAPGEIAQVDSSQRRVSNPSPRDASKGST